MFHLDILTINYIIQIFTIIFSFVFSQILHKFFILHLRRLSRKITSNYSKLQHFTVDIAHLIGNITIPFTTLIFLSLSRLILFIFDFDQFIISKITIACSIWLFFRVLSFFLNGKRGDFVSFIVSWITIIDDLKLIDTDKIDLLTFKFKVLSYSFSLNTIIGNLLITYVLLWISKTIQNIINKIFIKKKLDADSILVYGRIIKYISYLVVIIIMLNVLGIDLQHITLVGSALTFGIGLGMQKFFANFVSSMVIMTEKSIKINDLIEFDDGSFGIVKEMNMRSVIFTSPDGKTIIVPNEIILTSKIKNLTFSKDSSTRLNFCFGVEFSHKAMEEAKLIAVDVAKKSPYVFKGIEPFCVVSSVEDYYFNLKLFFWIHNIHELPSWSLIIDDIMSNVVKELEEKGVNMPFPIQDLRIHKVN